MKIGIVGAMPEEVNLIKSEMAIEKTEEVGGHTYHIGKLYNSEIILSTSGCGKSLAALTTTVLITKYMVNEIIFTGVAGAASSTLNVGDIVIGNNCFYHDMDTRPLFPKFRVPYTENSFFKTDPTLTTRAKKAAEQFLEKIDQYIAPEILRLFEISSPTVKEGTIATGDKFVTSADEMIFLNVEIKDHGYELMCVEMEGAAIAHICERFGIKNTIIRTISDNANHTAHIDFESFIQSVAIYYSAGILKEMLKNPGNI